MKATIYKSENIIKYTLPDSHIKANHRSDLIIINPKLVKRPKLKVGLTNNLANHCLKMSVGNGDFIELKS